VIWAHVLDWIPTGCPTKRLGLASKRQSIQLSKTYMLIKTDIHFLFRAIVDEGDAAGLVKWPGMALFVCSQKKQKRFRASSSLLGNQQSKFKNDSYVNFLAIIVAEWPELCWHLFWWQQTRHFLIKCSSYVPGSAALFLASKNDLFFWWLLQERVWEPHAWRRWKRFLTTWTLIIQKKKWKTADFCHQSKRFSKGEY